MSSGTPDALKSAPDDLPARNARTRTIVVIGSVILGLFLVLLMVGTVPRIWSKRELVVSASDVRNRTPVVYVIRPVPAVEVCLSLPATTQAIQVPFIHARTSGNVTKRYSDIRVDVTSGKLLAGLHSLGVDQQLH